MYTYLINTSLAKLVKEGKLEKKKFEECYTSWKSHAAFGNCDGIIKNLDEQISNILKGE